MADTGQSPQISKARELVARLERVFMPHASMERQALYAPGGFRSAKFVHYTSAEAALSIIASKRMWMRATTCMTDFREVEHGFEMLQRFFSGETKRSRFVAALDVAAPGAALEALRLFDQWWGDIRFQTYIASISVHDESKEDVHGRLAMWRAFGGSSPRVALVLNVPWYTGASEALNLMFSPVAYFNEAEVEAEIDSVIRAIRENEDLLRSTDRSQIVGIVFNMLVAGVVCLKHEGFREEREWRVIYSPKRMPSPLMESETVSIGGVPQIIYRIPLDASVAPELAGLDFAKIFDRLIIGPSQYSVPMHQAFVAALIGAGVNDAEQRVVFSGIPIRA